jgi:hypothetical protein
MRHEDEATAAAIEQQLRAELYEAREAYQRSKDKDHYAAYSDAIQRFSDFILRGIPPQ